MEPKSLPSLPYAKIAACNTCIAYTERQTAYEDEIRLLEEKLEIMGRELDTARRVRRFTVDVSSLCILTESHMNDSSQVDRMTSTKRLGELVDRTPARIQSTSISKFDRRARSSLMIRDSIITVEDLQSLRPSSIASSTFTAVNEDNESTIRVSRQNYFFFQVLHCSIVEAELVLFGYGLRLLSSIFNRILYLHRCRRIDRRK